MTSIGKSIDRKQISGCLRLGMGAENDCKWIMRDLFGVIKGSKTGSW